MHRRSECEQTGLTENPAIYASCGVSGVALGASGCSRHASLGVSCVTGVGIALTGIVHQDYNQINTAPSVRLKASGHEAATLP